VEPRNASPGANEIGNCWTGISVACIYSVVRCFGTSPDGLLGGGSPGGKAAGVTGIGEFASIGGAVVICLSRTHFNLIQPMKRIVTLLTLATCALAFIGTIRAEDSVAGKWKAQFSSQIGQQKYTFEFKVDGTNVTGKAIGERQMGTNEVAITEGKMNGDELSFVEPLKFQDNEVRVEYKGKLAGDELKLHRKVGDITEYDIVAKRVKPDADTNSVPATPDKAH